jgi:chromosome segregation ATPase
MSIEKLRSEIDHNAAELETLDEQISKCAQRILERQDIEEAIRQLQAEHVHDSDQFGKMGLELSKAREKRSQEETRKRHLLSQQIRLVAAGVELNNQLENHLLEQRCIDIKKKATRVQAAFTRFINQLLELRNDYSGLKEFKDKAPAYEQDVMRYFDASSEIQEWLLAGLRSRELITGSVAGMSVHQASQKADAMQMIKTLVGLLEHIKNPDAKKQFDEPPTEWMEATDKDLEDDDDV